MTFLPGGLRARRATAVAACALGLLVPARASAFCRTTTAAVPANYDAARNGCITDGLLLFWRGACVGYSIQRDAAATIPLDEATRIIDTAFGTWNDVTCPGSGEPVGIQVSNLGPSDCREVRYNGRARNQNLIVFRTDVWPYNDGQNTLGLTTVTFNAETGEIYDADMEINATQRNLSTTDQVPPSGFDLLSVVTHEAGHFLGLAHATDTRATMFANYRPGSNALRTLNGDDMLGVCTIYPSNAERAVDTKVFPSGTTDAAACDPTPRHGFSTACAAPLGEDDGEGGGCSVGPARGSSERSGAAPGSVALIAVALGAIAAAGRRFRGRV